jgi:TonB family protein
MSRPVGLIAIVLFLTFFGARLFAQEAEGVVVAETWVAAKPVERALPTYPASALSNAKEGWVMLSFVISPSGEVIEPMIEDSSGVEALENSALKAITEWRYDPAKRNGEPVEQSMVKTIIRFQVDSGVRGATPSFISKYRKIVGFVQNDDLAAAQPLLDEIEFGGRSNLYEDAWFWWLKYTFLEAQKSTDNKAKIGALRRAVGYEDDYLEKTQFVIAARQLFALEVKAGDLAAARRTFVRLRDSKEARRADGYDENVAALQPTFERIEELIASDRLLVTRADIGTHDYWVHDLLRRSFALGDIMGRVDVVDVRCTQGTKRYDSFPVDAVWSVPNSWGECGVYIKGEPGTTFAFEEYAARPPGAANVE